MQKLVFIKKSLFLSLVRATISNLIKPQVRVDTIEKKYRGNKIIYEVKFVIVRCRQPFTYNVDFLMNNIKTFRFNKSEIAILAFYQQLQILENIGRNNV
jgi:hypothetical protein